MKLTARVSNETGKGKLITGKEYLDIDLQIGAYSYALTLRYTDELEEYEPTLKGSGWILVNDEEESFWGVPDKGKREKGEWWKDNTTPRPSNSEVFEE